MDNNNIDDFFRQHSNTMDEAPGEALWQRIEGQLPLGSTVPTSSKISFSGSKFLLVLMVIATVIVGGIVFMRSRSREVLQPAVTKVREVITETSTKQDTVKKKKTVKNTKSKKQGVPSTTVKRKRKVAQDTVDYIMADTPEENISPPITETKITKVVKTNTVYNPKRTVITINEVVTQHVFDSITAANLEKYKNNAGMQLIVKEPRSGQIFRTTFEKNVTPDTLIFRPKQSSNQVEVVKFGDNKRNGNPIKVNLDSLKILKNTVKVQTIKLKLDSVAH